MQGKVVDEWISDLSNALRGKVFGSLLGPFWGLENAFGVFLI